MILFNSIKKPLAAAGMAASGFFEVIFQQGKSPN